MSKNNKKRTSAPGAGDLTLRIEYGNGAYQLIRPSSVFEGDWAGLASAIAGSRIDAGERVKWSVL